MKPADGCYGLSPVDGMAGFAAIDAAVAADAAAWRTDVSW